MQGPIAVALGGWDLSWLAGGLTSAAVYAVLGPRLHRPYITVTDDGAATTGVGAPDASQAPQPVPAVEL
jgi:toxin CptA